VDVFAIKLDGYPPSEPTFKLVAVALRSVADIPARLSHLQSGDLGLFWDIPDGLSAKQKLWLSKIVLQTLWRWRHVQDSTRALGFLAMREVFRSFSTDEYQILPVLKTHYFLTMAICLGLRITVRDLDAPNDRCVFLHPFHYVHLFGGSNTLDMAVLLFHQQLRRSTKDGEASPFFLTEFLSTLSHVNLFQRAGHIEYGFLWISDLLNSGYRDRERHMMASQVVQSLGDWFDSRDLDLPPSCIPPLLDFLSLSEELRTVIPSPSYPAFTALRMLLYITEYPDSGEMVLPILSSVLLPTRPLYSRSLALRIFCGFMVGWFSPRMEGVLYKDLNRFLQTVGDPFHFQLPNGQPTTTSDYRPMVAAVILIGFASSDLWRNHVRRSNFISCEEILSTEEGRSAALGCMFHTAAYSWSEFLDTPTKITAALRRLEELQCSNTAEVVILWAWTSGVANTVDRDGWGLIEGDTVNFYQTHGISRLTALLRHTTDLAMEDLQMKFLLTRYRGSPCRVGSVRRLVSVKEASNEYLSEYLTDLRIAWVCQVKRLYHLFGYDPATWKEEFGTAEVEEESGQFAMPVQPMERVRDYPQIYHDIYTMPLHSNLWYLV